MVKSLASIAVRAAGRSGTSTSARKPSLPRLTPSTGARCPSASRMARSMVPSPPRLTSRSTWRPSSSSLSGSAAQLSRVSSAALPYTLMSRWAAQLSTASTASAESRWGCRTSPTECMSAAFPDDLLYKPYVSSIRTQISLIVGYEGTACQSRSSGTCPATATVAAWISSPAPAPGPGQVGPDHGAAARVQHHPGLAGVTVGEQLGPGHRAEVVVDDPDGA